MDKIKNYIALIRYHQYVKNLFIFLPLFFVGQFSNLDLLLNDIIAFVAFSFAASSVYILNDFLDIEEDKKHPRKKLRPLASGLVSKRSAFLIMGLMFFTAIIIIGMLSLKACFVLLAYVILNLGYCFYLKHIPIVDISIIATGFILRLFIGSIVTDVPLSNWIVIMTFLLALFLALAKRRDDVLLFMKTGTKMRKVIDGYNIQFIDNSMTIMASVIIVSYILYTTSVKVMERVQSEYLYLTSLFVLLGVLRYLQISIVENNSGSPTKIMLKDKFIVLTLLGWALSFVFIIYF